MAAKTVKMTFFMSSWTMFQDPFQIFSRLGLKRSDVDIYLACLHRREGLFVYEICAITKINRSAVYLSLKRLINKSYINGIKVGGRLKYFAEKPDTIVSRQEKLLEELRDMQPILSKLGSTKAETEIRFYEGIDGIRQIYRDRESRTKFLHRQQGEVLSFSSGHDIINLIADFQQTVVKPRVKQKIPIRVIAPKSAKNHEPWRTNKAEFRTVKYFDDNHFPFSVSLDIYADSLAIYSPSTSSGGVIIRNEKISGSLRSLFNLVWKLST